VWINGNNKKQEKFECTELPGIHRGRSQQIPCLIKDWLSLLRVLRRVLTCNSPWESVFLLNSIAKIIRNVKPFIIDTGNELENLIRTITELWINYSV